MSELLDDLVSGFTVDRFSNILRKLNPDFVPQREALRVDDDHFGSAEILGFMGFSAEGRSLIVAAMSVQGNLNERRGRKQQYDQAKKVLRSMPDRDAALFVFYDSDGHFRLSFVHEVLSGARRRYSSYRRFTFFVDKNYSNKTFKRQLTGADFSKFSGIQTAFSVGAVSQEFYSEFLTHFDAMEKDIFAKAELKKADDSTKDFALLFAIRLIFLGFVQKRGWLADDLEFLPHFFQEYGAAKAAKKVKPDSFYDRWLKPMFHEALNSAPGRQVSYENNDWSDDTAKRLQMLPWLDGGLFQERALDRKGYALSDRTISDFLEFLFSYNFTIEENTLDDNELGLNPEFLGIIFERLINKENGAVYTPRPEVDFMCRMSLVRWLTNKFDGEIGRDQLYKLFFIERDDEGQSDGEFTADQLERIMAHLGAVTICDPAVGSGAFPVGMLHVLEESQLSVLRMLGRESEAADRFALRKNIIFNSLHGVDVAEWAVWICQLRLWITLFIDAPDSLRTELDPILPALDFKMRVGDSLVQRVGTKLFPVEGYPAGGRTMQNRIRELKRLKREYFDKPHTDRARLQQQETQLYADIIGAEIKELDDELKKYRGGVIKGAQSSLFVDEGDGKETSQQDLFEEKISELETRAAELRDKSNNLLSERPLVWSIEFADIFSELGGFDIVIGNPPYIRQESIGDPLGHMSKAEYKSALKEMVGLDFRKWDGKVDGKSDLYTYFYIRGLKLLNKDGVHVFICSNSWLDVGYGAWLQEFLLARAPLEYVFDNHAKRSFADADVNTIISVISSPRKVVDDEHISRFVAFKKSYEEVILTEVLIEIDSAEGLSKNEDYRIYPICNRELFEAGSEVMEGKPGKKMLREYVGEKWGGKFLRAPDVLFTILDKGKGKLAKLGSLSEVKRGITTGANEFFYLTKEKAAQWSIEDQFLVPVLKGPRDCKAIKVDPTVLGLLLFFCDKARSAIRGTGALKYIEWGEEQKFHKRPTVAGRENWWVLPKQLGNIFWVKESNVRLATYVADEDIVADCRLYYSAGSLGLKAVCNSTLYHFFNEANARAGLGLGARSLMVYEVNAGLIVDPGLVESALKGEPAIFNRNVEDIFVECGIDPTSETQISEQKPTPKPDRKELDDVIFNILGLSEQEKDDVYRGVCQLVWNRISKAEST